MNAETVLQNKIRCALSDYGICIRLQSGFFMTADGRPIRCGFSGMPDLLFLGESGQTIWLEVKTAKGTVRPVQERFMAKLHGMGHNAEIVRSVDEALKLVRK
jgi:hypothetical protein